MGCAAAGAVTLALAGCGGGDTVSEFSPNRLLVFGDETSLITADGRKYSVNGLDPVPPAPAPGASAPVPVDNPPTGPIDCRLNRIWVQVLADRYGFSFAQCSDEPAAAHRGIIYAAEGAKVAGIAAQITAHETTGGGFRSTDLATVFVGQHDVLEIYANDGGGSLSASQCRYVVASPGESGAAAKEARERGEILARRINGIADGGDGARVIFVTVPNQGATPFGRDQGDTGRECLRNLTDAFNAGLRSSVVQDGRQLGLVAIDERVERIIDDPDRFDYADNVRDGACNVALPDCTTATRITANEISRFLWADDLHFGPRLHDDLGELAESRVRNNPF
jgi:hypothetical protein